MARGDESTGARYPDPDMCTCIRIEGSLCSLRAVRFTRPTHGCKHANRVMNGRRLWSYPSSLWVYETVLRPGQKGGRAPEVLTEVAPRRYMRTLGRTCSTSSMFLSFYVPQTQKISRADHGSLTPCHAGALFVLPLNNPVQSMRAQHQHAPHAQDTATPQSHHHHSHHTGAGHGRSSPHASGSAGRGGADGGDRVGARDGARLARAGTRGRYAM